MDTLDSHTPANAQTDEPSPAVPISNLNVAVPGHDPITTAEKLNELINSGFHFYGELVFGGERSRIIAYRAQVDENTSSVVVGGFNRTRFEDMLTSTIRYRS